MAVWFCYKGKLLGAIDYAAKNSTSLNAVTELLGSCFAVLLEACHGVADKFELSDDTVEALADFKRCERERYDLLKKTEMDRAVDKREEGVTLLGKLKNKSLNLEPFWRNPLQFYHYDYYCIIIIFMDILRIDYHYQIVFWGH